MCTIVLISRMRSMTIWSAVRVVYFKNLDFASLGVSATYNWEGMLQEFLFVVYSVVLVLRLRP